MISAFRTSRFIAIASCLLGWTAAPAAAQTWDQVVAAAEREGAVTVLAPPLSRHRAVLDGFKNAYPKIKLQLSGLPASDFEPRIDAERKAGIYNWDVMVTGHGPTTYTMYIPRNWFAPIRDAILPENARDNLWLGEFDAGYMDKEKKFVWAMQAGLPRNTYVNRTAIPESELRTLDDLTKPQWKGKIAMFDPRVSGPGASVAARLLLAFGKEKTAAFFRDQEIAYTTTNRQLTEWVIRGQYPIGLGLSDEDVGDYQRRGLAADVKFLPGAVSTVNPQWGGVSLFNNAPHPNAAKVYINWLLSKETQTEWGKQTITNSRRLDAEPGDPQNVATADVWIKGLNLSSEAQLRLRLDVDEIVRSVLK